MANRVGIAVGAALGAAALGAAAWVVRDLRASFGGRSAGDREVRVRRSPQYSDGRFHNPEAAARTVPDGGPVLREMLFGEHRRRPRLPIPVVAADGYAATPTAGVQIVWYGHSTALVELDGRRVLVDPMWSDRCSPSRLVGPRRLHPVPVPIDQLPPVDAVVISHDHYDHLDLPTVRALIRSQSAPFVVPLGVGAHLEAWGVPEHRIIELDWNESASVAGLTLTATAAQHFSGRAFQRDRTLWASWVLAGPEHRVFYSGDTGYFQGYRDIGRLHGPFDAVLVQIGAYNANWPDIHMTPEEGVRAYLDLGGQGLLVPLHWATFTLAFHDWSEPADRLWREAKAHDVRLAIPRPGEPVDVDNPPAVDGWWQSIA